MRSPKTGSSSLGPSGAGLRLAILFLAVFVDLVGFGIVLPLLPFYADRFGASGVVIGFLVLSYSAAQLLLAPVWGRLSDRFGRRPILIIGLVGSAISYVVFAYAGSVAVLLLSRVMAGVGGANIPVAQAYIADVTPPERRAANMGLIGAAFGLGFIFGPAIGGLLAPVSTAAPGLAAAALCAGNAVLAFFFLPESLTAEERADRAQRRKPHVHPLKKLREALGQPELQEVLLLSFLFTVAFSSMHPTFPLFAAERFGLEEREVGYLFAFLGLVSAIMQGGIVRLVAPRVGEVALIRSCSVFFVAGLLLIGLAPSIPALLAGLTLLAVGFGGTLPSVVSLISRFTPADLQGGSLGVGQSVGALARICGPLIAGLAFDHLGVAWPYLVAAFVAIFAGLVSLQLRQPRAPERETVPQA